MDNLRATFLVWTMFAPSRGFTIISRPRGSHLHLKPIISTWDFRFPGAMLSRRLSPCTFQEASLRARSVPWGSPKTGPWGCPRDCPTRAPLPRTPPSSVSALQTHDRICTAPFELGTPREGHLRVLSQKFGVQVQVPENAFIHATGNVRRRSRSFGSLVLKVLKAKCL